MRGYVGFGGPRYPLTFGGYGAAMAKDSDKDPLARWRHAEAEYAEAAAAFLGKGDAPHLKKSVLIELVSLRSRADKWRERYFKQHYSK